MRKPQAVSGDTYRNITPEEAKRRLDTEQRIILLDVRTPAENREKRIPGSLLLPVDEIEQKALTLLPDKNATIIVYCRSGRRSVTASVALVKLGYKNVYNLGGIIDWPYETESRESSGKEIMTMDDVRALAAGRMTPAEVVSRFEGRDVTSGIHSFYTELPDGYALLIGFSEIENPLYVRLTDKKTNDSIELPGELLDEFLARRNN